MRQRIERLARERSVQAIAVATAVVLVGVVALWKVQQLPRDAALEVGGTVVTQADLRQDVATLKAMYGVEPPRGAAKLSAFWRDAAQATGVSEVLDQSAADEGITVSQRKVDEALASYLRALYQGAADTQDRFTQALATAGTSRRAVKDEIRRRLLVDQLTTRVTAQASAPTDADVQAAFAQRKCSLDVPERRRLRNIVVSTRAEAAAIRSDLADGASFTDLARTRSADTTTRSDGGDLGAVARSQLETAYGEAAFGAAQDAVFGPVKTASGWNVGRVVKIVPASRASLATVRDALAQQLLLERQSVLWKSWLEDRIDAADIRYAAAYQPAHPHRLPAGIASWARTQEGRCAAPAADAPTLTDSSKE